MRFLTHCTKPVGKDPADRENVSARATTERACTNATPSGSSRPATRRGPQIRGAAPHRDLARRRRLLGFGRPRPPQAAGAAPADAAAGAAHRLPPRPRNAARLGREADAPADRRPRATRLRLDRNAALLGAQSAHFSFDMTAGSFLEGHRRIFDWLGGVATELRPRQLPSAATGRPAPRTSPTTGRWI